MKNKEKNKDKINEIEKKLNKNKKDNKIIIQEGKAKIRTYKGEIKRRDITFYNPNSKINRDLGILVLNAYHKKTGRDYRVIDVMSATGVRGIRYALEAKGVKEVVLNDINPEAVKTIKENVRINKIEEKNIRVIVEQEDANVLLNKYRFLGDVIALDPFGSAVYYLEALARSAANKSIISIIFTDTPVLCGVYPAVAKRRYFTNIKKIAVEHEVALRVALKNIAQEMAKFDKSIKPIISLAKRHYIALYLEIKKSKHEATSMLNNIGYLHFCPSCQYRWFSNESNESCPYCGTKVKQKALSLGPLWVGELHNKEYLNIIEESVNKNKEDEVSKEVKEIINRIKKESEVERGKYYDLHKLAKQYKQKVISNKEFINAINNKGYKAVRTHISNTTILTNAPFEIIVDIINRINQISQGRK